MHKKTQIHLLVALSFLLIVFLSKLSTLNTPYYWDEIGWIRAAYWLSQKHLIRALPGLHPLGTFFGHPTGLHASMALIFKIFGRSIWVAHFFIVCLSFIGVYFTYLLGRHLFGMRAGIFGALFLFFTPMYFAQSGMYLGDVPVAAFGVMSIYFGLRKKYFPYLLAATYLVFIKETGAAIILAFVLYVLITEYKNEPAFRWEILKYSIPLWGIAAFLICQKFTAGKFVGIYAFEFDVYKHTFEQMYLDFVQILKWIFVYQYRWLFTSLIVLHFLVYPKHMFRKELFLFLLIFALATLPFFYFILLPRYLLPFLPYLCLMAAWSLFELVRLPRLSVALSGAITALYIFSLSGSISHGTNEWNMKYVAIANMHKSMAEYIEQEFSGSSVLTQFPFGSILANPQFGYVSKPFRTVGLTKRTEKNECDLILFSYTQGNLPIIGMNFVQHDDMVLIKRMAAENFVADLYGKPTQLSDGK